MTDELRHHGIIGQKWGVRRYQNKDGSLTSAGKKRLQGNSLVSTQSSEDAYKHLPKVLQPHVLKDGYEKHPIPSGAKSGPKPPELPHNAKTVTSQKQRQKMSDEELKKRIERLEKEKKLKDLEKQTEDDGKIFVEETAKRIGGKVLTQIGTTAAMWALEYIITGSIDPTKMGKRIPTPKDQW